MLSECRLIALCIPILLILGLAAADESLVVRKRSVFVDKVWSGQVVGFAFATRGDKQYVAYYDADRWMTVACRSFDSTEWQKVRLDNQVGWDSHNFIAFAFDSEGHIHLSGNMHGIPLRYYRTTRPGDITSLVGVHRMTGEAEDRVTYPKFYTGPRGEFLFTYRDGSSGNGRQIINAYDVKTKTWKRYIEKPLLDGEGKMNAYAAGPARDRSGTYHMAWVWRDEGGCETNHDVSYARSPGSLENWQRTDGTPIPLPITIGTGEIIDHAPVKSGLMNSVKLSFDAQDRPMVTYNKFDPKGRTQVYTMRLEDGRWRRHQTTNWPDRWDFSGGGSIESMIGFSGPSPWDETGKLYQTFTNKYQSPYAHVRFLEPIKLQPVGEPVRLYSPDIESPRESKATGWQVNIAGFSLGACRQNGSSWAIRWESWGPNRDQPRASIPPPSDLEVVELAIRQ